MFSGSPPLAWLRTVGNPGPRNPTTANKMIAKCPGELLKGIFGTCPQAIEPSHRHELQARWKHLAHQGLVLGMDSHSLVEVTYMLHRVCLTIVNSEHWLIEVSRKSCPFNLAHEDDLEIWFNAMLIASFPKPLRGGLLYLRL